MFSLWDPNDLQGAPLGLPRSFGAPGWLPRSPLAPPRRFFGTSWDPQVTPKALPRSSQGALGTPERPVRDTLGRPRCSQRHVFSMFFQRFTYGIEMMPKEVPRGSQGLLWQFQAGPHESLATPSDSQGAPQDLLGPPRDPKRLLGTPKGAH